MPHMLLIIEPVGQRATRTEAEGNELYDRMVAFGEDLAARGLLMASQSLLTEATRVQVRQGKAQIIDGPFAEAKEMVGGFYMLATENPDETLDIARACPAAAWATVEVRRFGRCSEDSRADVDSVQPGPST